MKTVAIVQARLGSTRLPGKVLKPLGGHTVLEEVLRRVRAVPGVDEVICATSEKREDDALVPVAEGCGVRVVRGSETDVLSRYCRAAEQSKADVVLRVTGDCPLIDPELCGAVLALRSDSGADYACNNMPPSFPYGLDCEAFTAEVLMRAGAEATDAYDREHVSPWMRREAGVKKVSLVGPKTDVDQRWALDFPEDYAFLSAVFDLLPPPPAIPPWTKVVAILQSRPDIATSARKRAPRGSR